MKKTLAVLSILSMTIPAVAREPNDLGDWRREMRESRRVEEPRAVPVDHTPLDAKGCAALKLDEIVISRGVFASGFSIDVGNTQVGEIETSGNGYVIKSMGSAVVARTGGSVVTDCTGAVLGWVDEIAGEDSSSFAIRDSSGRIVAASGAIDGSTYVIKGTGGMVAVSNNHWLLDSYKVSVSGIDPRLAAVAVVMNNAAGYRRAAQRRRDNPREPRGHDRN